MSFDTNVGAKVEIVCDKFDSVHIRTLYLKRFAKCCGGGGEVGDGRDEKSDQGGNRRQVLRLKAV